MRTGRVLVAVGAGMFVVWGVAFVLSLTLRDTVGRKRYGVVIDAGSSGSRAYVYTWTAEIAAGEELIRPDPNPVFLKIKPGLSTLGGASQRAVAQYLSPLLQFAKANVPADKHYVTPIFLRATAGLRLLPLDQQDELMAYTEVAFASLTSFSVVPDGRAARVIEGTHEGAYMWMALNYALQKLRLIVPLNATAGVLDCGGASTQIAFVPSGSIDVPVDYTVPFVPHVYSTSYLEYGKNEARYRLYTLLEAMPAMAVPNRPATYYNPCEPVGYDDHSSTGNVTLVGTSNATLCNELVYQLLNVTPGCPSKPNCAMDNQFLPSIAAHGPASRVWYGTDNFRAGFLALNMSGGDVQRLGDVAAETTRFCALNATEQSARAPPDSDPDDHPCFVAAWTTALMLHGYSFDPDTLIHYVDEISSSYGTYSVSWTLGAILHEAAIFVYPAPHAALEVWTGGSAYVAIVTVFGALAIFGLLAMALGVAVDKRIAAPHTASPLLPPRAALHSGLSSASSSPSLQPHNLSPVINDSLPLPIE